MKLKIWKDKFINFLINLGTSGKYSEQAEAGMSDYLIRYILVNFISIFGGIILIGFIIVRASEGKYGTVAACSVMLLIAVLTIILSRMKKIPQRIPAFILMIFFSLLCFAVTWLGEAEGSNFMFIYMYPLTTIMLLGMKTGIILSTIGVFIIALQMIIPGLSRYDYEFTIPVHLLVTYALVFTVMIVIEITRNTKDRLIEAQNIKLQEHKIKAEKVSNILENLLNSLTTMIYVTVPNTGEILFMNDSMKTHYNIEGDVRGQICYKVLQEGINELCDFCPCRVLNDDHHAVIKWEEQSTLTGCSYQNTDKYIYWLDGQLVHLQQSVDMTEMIEAKRLAESGNRAKSDFLAKMSHEIRTPMNAIIGIAQIQLQKADMSDEYTYALEKIYHSGQNLLNIINDILDFSKIETGKMELNNSAYDVPSLINDSVQLNIVQIGLKPLDFILEVSPDLPCVLIGDEIRLKQILNNLLSNSIKYTEKGYVKLYIDHFIEDSTPKKDEIFLRFVIEDTGQGMKPEDVKKLFSEYSRFNIDLNRMKQGTGLGLTITKNLVEMMEGKISAESEYTKGSKFTVEVKQTVANCDKIGTELVQQLSNFTFMMDKYLAKLQINYEIMPYGKVLVVDDMETNLYVAEGLLAPYELNIETALSGFIALEKVSQGSIYDIIFMDHMMPGIDGIETTYKLREMGYNGTIIALTANALAGNDKMYKKNGFDDFIAKPINIVHLNDSLIKYIKNKNQEAHKLCNSGETREINNYKKTVISDGKKHLDPKLIQIFYKDAKNSMESMLSSIKKSDIKLYTTNIHALKTMLASIGEPEISALANDLETAGLNNDFDFIYSNNNAFIEKLTALLIELSPYLELNKEIGSKEKNIEKDQDFLNEQLEVILNACSDYDDNLAYSTLDLLNNYSWNEEINESLKNIHETLFLHSDFEKAIDIIKKIMSV